MFVARRLKIFPRRLSVSKRLLSNEFKEVLQTRLEPPAGADGNQLQLAAVSRNLNALNLDLFVNNLSPNEDKRSAVLNLLSQLRSSHMANTCLESTSFAAVRHLLDNSSMQEVVSILLDRTQFGIFLNNFTAFAVLEALHKEAEYELALPLSLKLILLDELESSFVQAFCVKSIMVKLNKDMAAQPAAVTEEPKKPVGKQQEKKVRVKYLRNPLEIDVKSEMGKALLKIAFKVLTGEIQENAKILGYVLTKKHDELRKTLDAVSTGISPDVSQICKDYLTKNDGADIVQKLEEVAARKKTSSSFEQAIDNLISEYLAREDKLLAEEQKKIFPLWQQKREETKKLIETEISIKERKQTIENITNEIAAKKQHLWFFDEEEKLDLEIFNKRVFYPKRWFGKKKKPRAVDENYVPPQIRKIN